MGRNREEPIDPFVLFLMEESKPPLNRPVELAVKTGKSIQLITKYCNSGVDDLGKRVELVRLCGIPTHRFQLYMSREIVSRLDGTYPESK